eukprot:100816-Chlamydomonas_euryale.AAC.7
MSRRPDPRRLTTPPAPIATRVFRARHSATPPVSAVDVVDSTSDIASALSAACSPPAPPPGPRLPRRPRPSMQADALREGASAAALAARWPPRRLDCQQQLHGRQAVAGDCVRAQSAVAEEALRAGLEQSVPAAQT